MENQIQVIEVNEGTKIQYQQMGNSLVFGDMDLMFKVSNYQRDEVATVDVMSDWYGALHMHEGVWLVAQVEIPAATYTEEPDPKAGEDGGTLMKRVPLDMSTVKLSLWSIDGAPGMNV